MWVALNVIMVVVAVVVVFLQIIIPINSMCTNFQDSQLDKMSRRTEPTTMVEEEYKGQEG